MFLDQLFPGYEVLRPRAAFRVVRDSDIENVEEAEDLDPRISQALLKDSAAWVRSCASRSRRQCPSICVDFIIQEIEADPHDVIVIAEGMLGLSAGVGADHRATART